MSPARQRRPSPDDARHHRQHRPEGDRLLRLQAPVRRASRKRSSKHQIDNALVNGDVRTGRRNEIFNAVPEHAIASRPQRPPRMHGARPHADGCRHHRVVRTDVVAGNLRTGQRPHPTRRARPPSSRCIKLHGTPAERAMYTRLDQRRNVQENVLDLLADIARMDKMQFKDPTPRHHGGLIAEYISLRDQKKVADVKFATFIRQHYRQDGRDRAAPSRPPQHDRTRTVVSGAGGTAYKKVDTSVTVADAKRLPRVRHCATALRADRLARCQDRRQGTRRERGHTARHQLQPTSSPSASGESNGQQDHPPRPDRRAHLPQKMQERRAQGLAVNRNFATASATPTRRCRSRARCFASGTGVPSRRRVDERRHPMSYLDVVLVNASPYIAKTYYEHRLRRGRHGAAATAGRSTASSPTPRSTSKVNPTCLTCPMNQFGSRVTERGVKAKACQDQRRIAITMAHHLRTMRTRCWSCRASRRGRSRTSRPTRTRSTATASRSTA